jgi:hypothetical protein
MTQNEARKRLLEALKKVKRVYLADHITAKHLRDVELALRAALKQVNRK